MPDQLGLRCVNSLSLTSSKPFFTKYIQISFSSNRLQQSPFHISKFSLLLLCYNTISSLFPNFLSNTSLYVTFPTILIYLLVYLFLTTVLSSFCPPRLLFSTHNTVHAHHISSLSCPNFLSCPLPKSTLPI